MQRYDEEEIFDEDPQQPSSWGNPVSYVLQFLAANGWYMVGGAALMLCAYSQLRPVLRRWRQAQEDAEYHKDPDAALARLEAIQRARELQQQKLLEASERAAQLQREREEQKRRENLERLEKYGASGGRKLGGGDDDFLPLSGGASTSSYRAPKRSACSRGGCGR